MRRLAEADVGVAMATGTNIAVEAADVIIPGDRLTNMARTISIARMTRVSIRQNLFFAFVYNATLIPVAAIGLLGASGPIWAAIAMGLSDVTVIGNAIRLGSSATHAQAEQQIMRLHCSKMILLWG